MVKGRPASDQMAELQRSSSSRDHADRVVGSVACVVGMLVVLASIPSPSRTGLLATTGVVLGAFGYLLDARWLGTATFLVSAVVILAWLLA